MSAAGQIKRIGRPKGSPNKLSTSVKLLSRQYTEEAIMLLADVMRGFVVYPKNGDQKAFTAIVPVSERIDAARILLDRGYGRPAQALTVVDENDEPLPLGDEGIIEIRLIRPEAMQLINPDDNTDT